MTGLTGVRPSSSVRYRFTGRPSTFSTSSSSNAGVACPRITTCTRSESNNVTVRNLARKGNLVTDLGPSALAPGIPRRADLLAQERLAAVGRLHQDLGDLEQPGCVQIRVGLAFERG